MRAIVEMNYGTVIDMPSARGMLEGRFTKGLRPGMIVNVTNEWECKYCKTSNKDHRCNSCGAPKIK